MTQDEVLAIFRETGALLEGHFILRSGLRSPAFFQCARVCEHLHHVSSLAEVMLDKLGKVPFDTVVSPAMGGLVIGQEVARQAQARFLFVEKKADGALEMRRGFRLRPSEKVLVVEDVVTRGGRVDETLAIVAAQEAEAVAVAVVVDRSEGRAQFPVPLTSVLAMSFPTYDPANLPPELAALPPEKPGS